VHLKIPKGDKGDKGDSGTGGVFASGLLSVGRISGVETPSLSGRNVTLSSFADTDNEAGDIRARTYRFTYV
jgi:hypothetical protein